MVKCPFCGCEDEFKLLKNWRFGFYDVRMLECPRCGRFSHYLGVTLKGRCPEFVIRVKPRVFGGAP